MSSHWEQVGILKILPKRVKRLYPAAQQTTRDIAAFVVPEPDIHARKETPAVVTQKPLPDDFVAAQRGYREGGQEPSRKAAERGAWNRDLNADRSARLPYNWIEGSRRVSDEDINRFRREAERGDADAQCRLSICYKTGNGVSRDDVEAVRLNSLAAEQGNPWAQYCLGQSYFNRCGVRRNKRTAFKWLHRAAENGFDLAQYYLGFYYYHGHRSTIDDNAAAHWFRRAADQGNLEAQCHLAFCFLEGRGVLKDKDAANRWYRRAEVQKDAKSRQGRGLRYQLGRGVLKRDSETEALLLFATELSHPYSVPSLGLSLDYRFAKLLGEK